MLPVVNDVEREVTRRSVGTVARREVRRLRWVLWDFRQSRARPRGRPADSFRRNGAHHGVPEFCGAEHVLAQRSKDRATGEAVYRMVDWYKDFASKFGTVLGENPSPGTSQAGS